MFAGRDSGDAASRPRCRLSNLRRTCLVLRATPRYGEVSSSGPGDRGGGVGTMRQRWWAFGARTLWWREVASWTRHEGRQAHREVERFE
jgi:hypothetical protein